MHDVERQREGDLRTDPGVIRGGPRRRHPDGQRRAGSVAMTRGLAEACSNLGSIAARPAPNSPSSTSLIANAVPSRVPTVVRNTAVSKTRPRPNPPS